MKGKYREKNRSLESTIVKERIEVGTNEKRSRHHSPHGELSATLVRKNATKEIMRDTGYAD